MKRKKLNFINIICMLVVIVCVMCTNYTYDKLYNLILELNTPSVETGTDVTDMPDDGGSKTEVETESESQKEEVSKYDGIKFYNVPLSEDIQMHIFYECDGYNIAPNLILAWIERESYYKIDAVSPKGAKGLMQISPKWHQDRMERLGCTDLLDPYQNISVGINFIAELKKKNNDITWVIMAYRYGETKATEMFESGTVTQYVNDILVRASELQREIE